jgi:hypothetical protein
MSQLTLLSSKLQLTKRFTKQSDGTFEIEPYPMAFLMTSQHYDYSTLEELKDYIIAAGNNGYCLLKGQLDRPLTEESRRGHTSPLDLTDLLVLDYDQNDGFSSPDDMLAAIDPALESVSYIWQPSSSTCIKPNPIRGHAFIRLSRPVPPALVKEWLIKLNLSVPALRQRIHLSKSGMSLCYPLDITVNQNDKLIYIAPPTCIGFKDPIEADRVRFIEREEEFYDLNPSVDKAKNDDLVDELIGELREQAGLKKRKPKYISLGGEDILINPARANVTSAKDCGEFVRLNLNGGDSWSYWYWKNSPELLRNFKGEPTVRLRMIDPEYWVNHIENTQDEENQETPLVFRDPLTDSYYNAIINPSTDTILFLNTASSKEKLQDFMRQYGKDKLEIIPDWTVEFDPSTTRQIDMQRKWMNAFSPSPFMGLQGEGSMPPTIEKVISHICVTRAHFEHFIHWLAYIFQKRTRAETAWLFQGTYGTGKGTLFAEILQPLFGEKFCHSANNNNMEDNFNSFLENKLILFLDEGDQKANANTNKVMALMKTYITDRTISIRAMRRAPINRQNHLNIIVAANEHAPIAIKDKDRRWNIAPRQEVSIDLRGQYHLIAQELESFAKFLLAYEVDEQRARDVIECDARDQVIEDNRSRAQSFIKALTDGDLDYFADFLTDAPPLPAGDYYAFERVIKSWMNHKDKAFEEDFQNVRTVFNYISDKTMSEKAFAWIMSTNGLFTERKRVDGKRARWVRLQFKELEVPVTFPERPDNVVNFR